MTTARRIALLLLFASSASAQLKYSPDSLYLVEKDGTPVFLNGTAPWDINNVSLRDAKRCLDSIASHGMNYCQIRAMSPALFGGIANAYGVNPWQGSQTFASTPTEAFWAHMDSVIGYAKSKHIYFMLYIDYLGGDGSAQGWAVQTANSTPAQMQAWGQYMGNRYKDSTNILWCASGDIAPTAWQTKLEAMITGLKSTGDTHLISTRDEPGTTTDTYWSTRPWVTLNGSYPFWPTWDVNVLQSAAKNMRARNPRKPAGLQEAWYEGEHGVAQTQLRSQSYWMTLGGSIAFQIFGNCPLWDFSKSTAFCGAGDWNQELDSQGMRNQRIFSRIVLGRKWYRLIPDTNHVVTTAGYGTWGGTDYAVTSYTSDSSSVLCYMPSTRQVTVNTNYIKAGGSVAASWLNPATGDSTYIGTFARSSASTFTPPAGADFVLALDATLTGSPVPPAAPVPTAPANGATGVSTSPTISWNASTGAASYRIQLSADSTFATTFLDQSGIATTSIAASGLANSKKYFWHVNATNTAGTSVYSARFSFTTTAPPPPPPAPVLATPANGSTGVATNPMLTWNASAGAASYRLQLSADSTFATTFIDQSGIAATSFAASGLSTGARYFWHVNAANTGGTSAYSGTFNFTTSAALTGLVAAYAFDEGAGTTVSDKSGNNLTGTIVGATWTTGGKYGKALSFNGSTGYVDLGNPSQLQFSGSMTVSAWVNTAVNPADDGQIIAKSNDATGWQLKTTPDTGPQTFGTAVTGPSGSHTQRYSTTVRSLNTWYYIAGVYDATTKTLSTYVNGVLNNGTMSGVIPASQVNLGVNVNIGRRSPGSWGGFYFNGIIDEVRVYNRVLSQAEIQADMNTPLSAPAAQLGPAIVGVQAVASSRTVKVAWSEKAGTASNVSLLPANDGGGIAAKGIAPKQERTIDLKVSTVENGGSSYQWQRDGVDIPGATGPAYTALLGSSLSDVTRIRCIAWNQSGADTSSDAVISNQPALSPDATGGAGKPVTYSLEQNYPNPFNPATTIQYATSNAGYVRLEVYNLMGQKVATLVAGEQEAGYHDVKFDASNLASGLYFYRIQAGAFNQTRKLQLIK